MKANELYQHLVEEGVLSELKKERKEQFYALGETRSVYSYATHNGVQYKIHWPSKQAYLD